MVKEQPLKSNENQESVKFRIQMKNVFLKRRWNDTDLSTKVKPEKWYQSQNMEIIGDFCTALPGQRGWNSLTGSWENNMWGRRVKN